MTTDIEQIRDENFAHIRTGKMVAVVEIDGRFEVHCHMPDGVAPISSYPTARHAAARALQLLHVGPVAPQTHPEEVCIGYVTQETSYDE